MHQVHRVMRYRASKSDAEAEPSSGEGVEGEKQATHTHTHTHACARARTQAERVEGKRKAGWEGPEGRDSEGDDVGKGARADARCSF